MTRAIHALRRMAGDRRGIGLVIAIWVLALIGFLAAAFGTTARTETTLARNTLDATRARLLADGAVHLAALALIDPRSRGQIRIDGAPATLKVDGEDVEVRIFDEGGKVDLNEAPAALIAALLQSAGAEARRAETIASAIVARRELPDKRDPTVFRTLAEFSGFPGMTPRLFQAVAPFVSVDAHQPGIDPWVAPAGVIAALPGFNRKEAEKFVHGRPPARLGQDGPPLGLRGAEAFVYPSPGTAFGIVATARSGESRFERQAVVMVGGDENRNVTVMAWR